MRLPEPLCWKCDPATWPVKTTHIDENIRAVIAILTVITRRHFVCMKLYTYTNTNTHTHTRLYKHNTHTYITHAHTSYCSIRAAVGTHADVRGGLNAAHNAADLIVDCTAKDGGFPLAKGERQSRIQTTFPRRKKAACTHKKKYQIFDVENKPKNVTSVVYSNAPSSLAELAPDPLNRTGLASTHTKFSRKWLVYCSVIKNPL